MFCPNFHFKETGGGLAELAEKQVRAAAFEGGNVFILTQIMSSIQL